MQVFFIATYCNVLHFYTLDKEKKMGEYKFEINITGSRFEIQIGNEAFSEPYLNSEDKNEMEERIIDFAKENVRNEEEMAMIQKALSVWKMA